MNKKTLTELDKNFIKEHRLEISMVDLSNKLNVSFYQVKKYMEENNLLLTPSEIQKIRSKSLSKTFIEKPQVNEVSPLSKKPNFNQDFWNSGLNPITMYRS
ncbi:hypothetical protein [Flavobacterium koreense]